MSKPPPGMNEPPKTEAEWIAALLRFGGNTLVTCSKHRKIAYDYVNEEGYVPHLCMIPLREAFRRWKIARKAWKTRKAKQLETPL